MKKPIFTIMAALLLSVAFTLNASAMTGTIWEPTESGYIDINYFGMDIYDKVAIFDDQASLLDSDPHFILKGNPGHGIVWDTIELIPVGDDYGIRHSGMPNTPRVILEGSNRFQVAMKVNGVWLPGFDVPLPSGLEPAYGQHGISWEGFGLDALLIQVDAEPVPVPAAAYLLGVGLMGLAIFRKKYS